MLTRLKDSKAILFASVLAFVIFAVYTLCANSIVLYTAHDRSEFLYGTTFFHTLLAKPFGLMQYVGAWLTQYFYYPAFGASLLMLIWALIFYVGKFAFRLSGNAAAFMLLPLAFLLASIVDVGYWIYILPIKGYWFSQSLGYLVMLLLLWGARSTSRKWHLVWYFLALCAYPVLGWFALLFVISLALSDKFSWRELVAFLILLFAANIWHVLLYSNQQLDDVLIAGLPRFETTIDSSGHLTAPFWLLGAVSILFIICSKYLVRWFVPVLCSAVGICYVYSLMVRDQRFIDEMRMVRYAETDDWHEVLAVASAGRPLTRSMVMLKNIALMNEGDLLDRSFQIGNDFVEITNPDSLHVSLLNIISPLAYYNYGMMNEAIRLSYENAVPSGFSPFYLKVLARCAKATGETELMDRFITILHHHPFYDDWQPTQVSEIVNDLQQSYPDEICGVENSDSYVVNSISLWFASDYKVASEQALLYAMLRCDSSRFWPSLRKYVKLHMNDKFPLHAQEAYIMFMDKAPEEKRMMIPVEQSVYDRYKQFWSALESLAKPGVTLESIGQELRDEWGDTYWWYNIFGKKIY